MRSWIGPLLCLCLLVPLVGCDDDPATPLTPEQQLVGRWAWASTFNPWTGETATPANTDDSGEFVFRDDGSYERVWNGDLVQSGRYTLETVDGCSEVSLGREPWQLDGNRLINDTTPVDGPAIVYRKTSRIP